ncbi:hypothetical protein [Bacillus multifaciens]|uniref:hypothetical protein n=1 Tax=Bacillus multifaciens TaxID=3068506 RepID=UPI0027426246|nr:hypothetical protein [Bacillus sp. WLY-B-L8]MDP7981008.1 hypothetical protein [Bacillus sp. WLY-B-L8]
MKSRRKKQLARLQKKQEITLQQAWDRVCEELETRSEVVWFVQKHVHGDFEYGWNISSAHNRVLVTQSGGKN